MFKSNGLLARDVAQLEKSGRVRLRFKTGSLYVALAVLEFAL